MRIMKSYNIYCFPQVFYYAGQIKVFHYISLPAVWNGVSLDGVSQTHIAYNEQWPFKKVKEIRYTGTLDTN